MLGFVDATATIKDEKKDARMAFRTQSRVKQRIQQAAALAGVDETAFAVSAAFKEAERVIEAHERTTLHPVDHKKFFEAIDNPPAPTQTLREAVRRHSKRVVSR